MAANTPDTGIAVPARSPYGRFIRERGTLRLLALAIVVGAAYYLYGFVRTVRLQSVQWPPLHAVPDGLTVVGLTKDFVAIEANHAWQFRTRDDADAPSDYAPADRGDEDAPERASVPAVVNRTSGGQIVSAETIVANCPVVLTGAQFAGARLEQRFEPLFDRQYWLVHVTLTPEGRSRYWQYSLKHAKERLVFVLKGEAITCPIMEHMDTSALSIEPIWVKADAQRLADYINAQRRR